MPAYHLVHWQNPKPSQEAGTPGFVGMRRGRITPFSPQLEGGRDE
jgi:hypothetical protein